MSYYNIKPILKKNATYSIIFGERSNGKTYATLKIALEKFFKGGEQFIYLRRWKEDINNKRGSTIFNPLIENGEIERLSNGLYQGVFFYTGKFYLCTYDENRKPIYNESDLLGYALCLTDTEHDKSTSYPKITSIIFDEFLTNRLYLQDEFVIFMNVISTIVRRRENVKIFMLGNTVNKYCPYFQEMGLDNILDMKQGTIDIYNYGDSGLTVAVEYCETLKSKHSKESRKYFAFNNPKLQMITGGAWELAIYPHLPVKYKPNDVLLTFFIEFSDNIFACELISQGELNFIYIHEKTTPVKDTENSIIYSFTPNAKMNYNTNLFKPKTKIQAKILEFFKFNHVFYQNNSVGDAVANFIKICKGA